MPEISARDLRRLKALETRLAKTEERRKALAAERKGLREAAATAARRERECKRQVAVLEDRLEAVLAENKELAARLEEGKADLDRLGAAGDELRAKLDGSTKELEQARTELGARGAEVKELSAERDRLAERIAIADEQLSGKEMTPVLPTKEVSKLLDDLFRDVGRGIKGLDVSEGEIRLHVAFGKVGKASGFVVPSADAPEQVRENLHTVTLRFDRLGVEPRR